MTVKAILSRKGGDVGNHRAERKSHRGRPNSRRAPYRRLIVTGPDNRVAGILSERDIVRR